MKYLAIMTMAFVGMTGIAHGADINFDNVPEVTIKNEKRSFYIKGYLGGSILDLSSFDHMGGYGRWSDKASLDDANFMGGVGVGYRFSDLLRVDGTVEYRAKNKLGAKDRFGLDERRYSGDVSSTVLMANAYVDLATVKYVTPYLGFGVGAAANHISDFSVQSSAGKRSFSSNTNWDFAWALHTGFAVKLNQRATLDIGYSYSDLGDAKTGNNHGISSMKADHLTSHDIKIGLRYAFR